MILGWRPKDFDNYGPIGLSYDYGFPNTTNIFTGKSNLHVYSGPRFKDSYVLHKTFSKKSYPFIIEGRRSIWEFKSNRIQSPDVGEKL